MDVVDPPDEFRRLDCGDVKIYHETLLTAAREHAVQLYIVAGIDFLVRKPRRNIEEIARARWIELPPLPHRK